jgi:hypothetical protein
MINWVVVFNRMFELINQGGEAYFGGSRFLNVVRETSYDVPSYTNYIESRRKQGLSTSRRDYYFDLLMEQNENDRIKIVNQILSSIEHLDSVKVKQVREHFQNLEKVQGPKAEISAEIWNSDRLIEYLERMDTSIEDNNYEHTLTLSYTCLEGMYKSFIREKIDSNSSLDDLTRMSVEIRKYIEGVLNSNGVSYPKHIILLISTITNAIGVVA